MSLQKKLKPISDLIDLSDKKAIVTGGAVGIGLAISYSLAEAGAAVMIADIDGKENGDTYQKYLEERAENVDGISQYSEGDMNSKFFYIQENIRYKRKGWRLICSTGYIIGAIFFLIVLIQNFIYVFNSAIDI